MEFISNIGTIIKQLDDTTQKAQRSQGEQLTNIVQYMSELARQNGIKEESLWLPNIPETIFLKNLRKKYNIRKEEGIINPIIGEYDDPYNQKQGIVDMDLSNRGNTVIYGNAESGKETLLSTMIYDLISTYTAEEAIIYILDFGTEALKIFEKSSNVGDVVFINDQEKIIRLFEMLQNEIKARKTRLLDYNGDYNLYIRTNGKSMPMIIITINNYEAFSELYQDKYDDILLTLTRDGIKCGIVFIITANASNNIRYRLSQNFKQKICLQLNDDNDYYGVFDKIGKKRPSHIFGRGLININDEVYEFQTAKLCKAEDYTGFINDEIERLNKLNTTEATSIPVMPELVTFESVHNYLKDLTQVPIGVNKKDLKVFNYNFRKEFVNLVTARDIESATQFVGNVIEELKELKNINIVIFNAEIAFTNRKIDIKNNFIRFVSDFKLNNRKTTLCIIIGMDKFLGLYKDLENRFNTVLKEMETIGNCSFIIVENVNKLKNHEYEDWFKNYVSKDSGIWIGNGLNNQYLMIVNSDRGAIDNNCGRTYGYAIREGIVTLIKLLEMKNDGDDNE